MRVEKLWVYRHYSVIGGKELRMQLMIKSMSVSRRGKWRFGRLRPGQNQLLKPFP